MKTPMALVSRKRALRAATSSGGSCILAAGAGASFFRGCAMDTGAAGTFAAAFAGWRGASGSGAGGTAAGSLVSGSTSRGSDCVIVFGGGSPTSLQAAGGFHDQNRFHDLLFFECSDYRWTMTPATTAASSRIQPMQAM